MSLDQDFLWGGAIAANQTEGGVLEGRLVFLILIWLYLC